MESHMSGTNHAQRPPTRPVHPLPDAAHRIRAALDWLVRSQEVTGCGGSAAFDAPVWGRAAQWLVSQQDADGRWYRRFGSRLAGRVLCELGLARNETWDDEFAVYRNRLDEWDVGFSLRPTPH
jgi:hypothetical protein